MLKPFEIRISSNWINALNFLIFDVILISLVFYLTADVMGRLNDSTLRDGEPHRIIIACPPVLGGGLCSTHHSRALILLFARFLGLGLILMTNLTIKGSTLIELQQLNQTVLSRGSISNFTATEFTDAMVIRASCQGNKPSTANDIQGSTLLYYGELRGPDLVECVTNRTLMATAPVEFGSEIVLRNMTTGLPCEGRRRTVGEHTVAEYFCPNATLSCLFDEGRIDFESCRGLVEQDNDTYMCEEGAARPEMELQPTHGRWVQGIHFRSKEWLDAIFISAAPLKDAIDATFAATTSPRLVTVEHEVQLTQISPLWLVALAFKVLLVAALAVTSTSLKRAGFRTVAHDEQRLAEILNTGLQESGFPGRRRTGEEEAGIFLNAAESTDGLLVYADSRPRRNGGAASRTRAGHDARLRNQELHIAEELYY